MEVKPISQPNEKLSWEIDIPWNINLPSVSDLSSINDDGINRYEILLSNLDIVFRLYVAYPEHFVSEDSDDDDIDDYGDNTEWTPEIDIKFIKDPAVIEYIKNCFYEFCERYFGQSIKKFMYGYTEEDRPLEDDTNQLYRWSTAEMYEEIFRFHTNTNTEFKERYHDMFTLERDVRNSTEFRNNTRLILNEFCKKYYNIDLIDFVKS
jgi:hypothetical protein